MAFAHVLNEERFNPARLSNLSLWLDAQSPSTMLATGSPPQVNLTWTVITPGAQSGVSLSLDQTILYSLTFNTGIIAKISLLTGVIIPGWAAAGANGARTMITGVDGNLYVTEAFGHIIQVITATGVVNKTWCRGIGDDLFFSIQATDTNFYSVTARSGKIVQISPSGTVLNLNWASGLVTDIRGIAQGIDGNFYVATNLGTIIQFSPTGVVLNLNWVSGLGGLRGIVQAADGNFYVTGFGNGTIIKISPSGVVLNATYVSGLPAPYQIAITSDGVLYVSSTTSSYISKIVLGSFYWTDKSSNANNFYKVFGTANPLISNTLVNQPSVFFPPGAQMVSTFNSDLGSPTIPGCVLWLDAADQTTIIKSGSTITQWNDKSGKGSNAVVTAGSPTLTDNALNGLSVLTFGGTTYLTSPLSMPSTGSLTYFAVARPNDTTVFRAVSAINGGGSANRPNTLMTYKSSTNYWWFSGGTGGVDGNTNTLISSTTRNDIIANYWSSGSPGSTQVNINGTSYASSTAAPPSLKSGGTFLVGIASGLSEFWIGTIAEIIVFNSTLTISQRQLTEGYLATKWGLRSQLPPTHPYFSVPYTAPFTLNPSTPVSKSVFMVYQCVSPQSAMRFSVGNDVSGQAFGFAQSNSTVYSPYQYGYGDTRWMVDANTYILPNFVSGISDASATMIRGDYNFNPDRDVRETALQNLAINTPFTLGTSLNTSSIFVSANFHVCEIIAYNRALSTTERQMIEGYVGWKWGMASRLPTGHPYEKFPPSGEQVVSPSTPLNVFSGLVSWLDMSDPSTYTLSGTNLKTIRDKVGGAPFTIGGNQNALPLSTIGGLPSLNFPGNVTGTLTTTTNPFLSKTIAVPSQGCAIAVMIPRVQYTAATLGMFGWGKPGNPSNNPGLGYNAPTATVSTLQSYNTGTSVFFGPSLSTVPGSPTIIFWAWYGGNMFYLSSNGNTILSSTQTGGFYNSVSTDNTFYIGNDGGYGAQFNLGELCMYNEFLETPFRNILEGYLAWKWGMPKSLPVYHPYYLAAPSLQTLTEVNALSQPPNITGLTMWVDAADTTTMINTVVTPSVVLTGSYTFLATTGGYDYYKFTGNGTVKTNIPISVQYLAVGGGGGGASAMNTGNGNAGGGGGSGGLKTNTSTLAVAGQSLPIPSLVANATYTIVVGGGGNAGIFQSAPAGNGGSTTFAGEGINVIANGGGFGINSSGTVLGGAADIGSGAGGGSGGTGGTAQRNAGAGGGVLSAGALGNATTPGAGGNGLVFLTVPFGAGGGAGGYNKSGVAGSAGGTLIGGAGGIGAAGGGAPATSGTANTGSGGGGAGKYGSGAGGGSGVFILGIPSGLSTGLFTWLDKSVVSNNLVSSASPPTASTFGTPLRPSVYFSPGTSLRSTYNSGANTGQFSAFLVASVPTLSYLLVTTGQLTQASVGVPGQTFGFYASNGTTSVFSPYVVAGSGATNNAVGTYSTINGKMFEAFASVNGTTLSGNMNFTIPLRNVVNTATAIPATPWVFGDCIGDILPKSFHVHEFITYSRVLSTAERQTIEGYLYWKWLI